MKDKLTKKNLVRHDYIMRKLGVVGTCFSVIALACLLPMNINLSNQNVALNNEINHLEDEKNTIINSLKEKMLELINDKGERINVKLFK